MWPLGFPPTLREGNEMWVADVPKELKWTASGNTQEKCAGAPRKEFVMRMTAPKQERRMTAPEKFENRLSATTNGNSQSVVSKKSSKRHNRWQHSLFQMFRLRLLPVYRCFGSTKCVGEKGRDEDTTSSRRNLKETSQLKVDEIIKCRRHN